MNSTSSFDAVLFDLDGVLTSTAALHATAWKRTFDAMLGHWGQDPFGLERDHLDHIDGRPRAAGVRDFLASRGITLDDASVRTIAASPPRCSCRAGSTWWAATGRPTWPCSA
jgi:beta-phosphoglucomutase-like phosphatase (HAD superfamily)